MGGTIKERLTAYLRYKGINKSEFGRIIGVSNAYISSIRKYIQPDKAGKIASSFPDLNIVWLITGEGEMLKDAAPSGSISQIQTATGHHINQSVGDSGLTEQLEKANREIERLQSQLAKAQEQNDRLLKIIENMSK